jgi:hypothetical protein
LEDAYSAETAITDVARIRPYMASVTLPVVPATSGRHRLAADISLRRWPLRTLSGVS